MGKKGDNRGRELLHPLARGEQIFPTRITNTNKNASCHMTCTVDCEITKVCCHIEMAEILPTQHLSGCNSCGYIIIYDFIMT